MTRNEPDLIILLSGKRKSGKDYVAHRLMSQIDKNKYEMHFIQLSEPLKREYALQHNNNNNDQDDSKKIDYKKLMDSSEYKEKYRCDMIEWGERKRALDYGYFCKLAIEKTQKRQDKVNIWLVGDCRRKTDVKWFEENYPLNICVSIRIQVRDEIRKERNWHYVDGIDNAQSECDLDDFNRWNFMIDNNSSKQLDTSLNTIVDFLDSKFQ